MTGDPSGFIAVFDVGKTHVKLSVCDHSGGVIDRVTAANRSVSGGKWLSHDVAGLSEWLMSGLARLARAHRLTAIVPVGHGSCGALVGDDVEASDLPVAPMMDYENPLDPVIAADYAPLAGSFFDRGSALMLGSSHLARQLFIMERLDPDAVGRARHYLALPQFWAWHLSGVAVREPTAFGAQSHLVNVLKGVDAPIVKARGWDRLMAPWARAWTRLGRVRESLVRRFGLPAEMEVLAGIHDSSANLYRYRASGLDPVTVVSTGTWIVALSAGGLLDRLDERRGMTINADVDGKPVPGVLSMAGREFAMIAGETDGTASAGIIARLVARGSHALPGRTPDDGLFPGSAGKGRTVGPEPENPDERRGLALLFGAAMTTECLDALGARGHVVLDGPFVRDPLYPALVKAMSGLEVAVNADAEGVAAGAALLAAQETRTAPAPLALTPADDSGLAAGLPAYWADWRRFAAENASRPRTKA